jgi:hypothetical protein
MTALILGFLLAAPWAPAKTGGLPPMLLDPQGLVSGQSGGLPGNLGSVLDQVVALPGATFGVGVVDLKTGERITRNGTRRFYMDTPDIINAAVCVSRHRSGEFPLDSLIARDEQLWQIARRGQQGSREATQSILYYMGGPEHVASWLAATGHTTSRFEGVQLDWAGAPTVAPSYTTVSDCLDFMEIVYGALDLISVRRMTSNPPLSEDLQATLGSQNIVYGWISDGGSTRCINLIVSRPDGARYGVSVLTGSLCCPGKADLGFTTIWNAL